MKKLAFSLLAGCLLAPMGVHAASLPASHLITNVPWHRQMNGLFCGAASLEIVLDYWGADPTQKAVADVARSSSIGTWSFDILRGGQFSALSAAQGAFFPNEAPTAGFPGQPLGYATFAHAAQTMWLDDLKALIAADIPVILLMYFEPSLKGGAHYRVAIGYDDAQGIMYFSDPWGRDMRYLPGMSGVIAWSYADVQTMWNYVGYGTDVPFFGVAMMPWNVNVRVQGGTKAGALETVTATVTYPCPAPFATTQFPASATTATITTPAGVTVLGAPTVNLGTFAAGSTATVSWQLRVDQTPPVGATITVQAQGLVSGSVPAADWQGQSQSYPPYSYTDAIGGYGYATY